MNLKLKDIYLFQWIDIELINKIIDNSRRINIKKWDYIIHQWESSNNEAYIIQKWKASVEIDWKEVNTINPWEIFWEIALITDENRTASIKALEDLILLKINKELLHTIIKEFKNWKDIQKTVYERIMQNLKNK